MNWTDLLSREIDYTYRAAEGLMDLAGDADLSWKPSSGDNWMTTGQLLFHVSESCGMPMKGFVTGDWGLPEGASMDDAGSGDMLPPAESMPAVESVAEAKALLAADREVSFEMLKLAGEERMQNEPAPAPWDPTDLVLGPAHDGNGSASPATQGAAVLLPETPGQAGQYNAFVGNAACGGSRAGPRGKAVRLVITY